MPTSSPPVADITQPSRRSHGQTFPDRRGTNGGEPSPSASFPCGKGRRAVRPITEGAGGHARTVVGTPGKEPDDVSYDEEVAMTALAAESAGRFHAVLL